MLNFKLNDKITLDNKLIILFDKEIMKKINLKEVLEKLKKINFKDLLTSKKSIKLSQKQKIYFFDSLFNLINSWIPITNSLSILLYQTKDKNLKLLFESIIKDISKWKKLEDCFRDFSSIFSNFDVYMIKMWEVTGKITTSLETICDREEKNAELKAKIIWALIYPTIVITLAIAMIMWFMLFVIPKVQKMYSDAKVNLPELTQSVINTSIFLQNNYLLLIICLFWAIFWILTFKNNSKTKIYFDKWVLNIPLFWWLIRKKILAIFSHTFWTLLQNGIMINEALEIAKNSLDNKYYEKRIEEIILELNEWIALSESMWIKKIKESIEDPYFPLELASIVKIWEQTWKLPSLLIKISSKFNKEIDVIVKWLSTVIEPIVIVIVWIIVWVMVMAILLPFFNMVNVV